MDRTSTFFNSNDFLKENTSTAFSPLILGLVNMTDPSEEGKRAGSGGAQPHRALCPCLPYILIRVVLMFLEPCFGDAFRVPSLVSLHIALISPKISNERFSGLCL